MKKVLCMALMLMPFMLVKAEETFVTKNGTILENGMYEFIKEFGYSDEMIYEMSEEDLEMYLGADLSTVEMSKEVYYLPPAELPHGGISTLAVTKTTPYKTMTGSSFYNSTAGCYQLAISVDFHTIPALAYRHLDFVFLTWASGTEKNNGFLANGYYVRNNNVYSFYPNTANPKDSNGNTIEHADYYLLNSRIFEEYGTYATGASIMLPKKSGLTDATFAIAQQFTNQPTNTYSQNLDQYTKLQPEVNAVSNATFTVHGPLDIRVNDSSSITMEFGRYNLGITYGA